MKDKPKNRIRTHDHLAGVMSLNPIRDCQQSLFSSHLVSGVHASASVERRSRETRETRAAACQLRAWSFACLGRFAGRTKKKERLLVV